MGSCRTMMTTMSASDPIAGADHWLFFRFFFLLRFFIALAAATSLLSSRAGSFDIVGVRFGGFARIPGHGTGVRRRVVLDTL